jgi:Activator of Hsp90 ATPase homolog 1-like protein
MTCKRYSFFLVLLFCNVMLSSAASLEPVVTEGVVNAPVEKVWKAFTDKSVIEQWMVAKGIPCTPSGCSFAQVDALPHSG